MRSSAGTRGELALVLHSHMPYVEGFGTWPFGEEWLWEAIATCYLPLLDLLARDPPLTLSLTPVLCDQLEAPGVGERFLAFLDGVRSPTHARDIAGCRASGALELVRELELSAADYRRAAERFAATGGDLLGALARHATWTSAATHGVLPLLATDAGVRLQAGTGVLAARARLPSWRGGFWLPECGHAAWLDAVLADTGARSVCVDLTDVHGRGSPAALRPLQGAGGLRLVPLDRQTIELVWSDRGYPSHGAYRDYHHHTVHHHRPWANDGTPYDREAARSLARRHAADFVGRAIERLDEARARTGRPGLCVCALDTELLGHWWFEGLEWLAGVLDESVRQGLALTRLDDALERHEAVEPPDGGLPVTTWGTPRTLATWDGPQVADLVWQARASELRVVAAGERAPERALRELLALQSSDWAFMVSRRLAADYPRERAAGHARNLDTALRSVGCAAPALRNLAPVLDTAALTSP
ncbi:MAG TPA: 1,4-alpha-glucan branching protein domain-containing protein [Solirubrobacteraceae bacterium]|nr:1,4-alpha-glucan branching protein domain-containing protein [Solirubrobacteraceae bacterium]